MKNIRSVRNLLLKPDGVTNGRQQMILESVFDYLVDEGNGTPDYKIRSLMFGLICVGQGNQDNRSIPIHELSAESAANVVKALAYCFPDEFHLIPEIALADFRVHHSCPTIYKEEAGVHAMILITLLELVDSGDFGAGDSKSNEYLIALLIEGLQNRYFGQSIIHSHQVSLLSSALKKFVGRARGMLPLFKARWNSLCHIIGMSGRFFTDGDKNKPDNASLEYALLNELCFKLFNTLELETKAAMLRTHQLSVPA